MLKNTGQECFESQRMEDFYGEEIKIGDKILFIYDADEALSVRDIRDSGIACLGVDSHLEKTVPEEALEYYIIIGK